MILEYRPVHATPGGAAICLTPRAPSWNSPLLLCSTAFPPNLGASFTTAEVPRYDAELKIGLGQAKLLQELKP